MEEQQTQIKENEIEKQSVWENIRPEQIFKGMIIIFMLCATLSALLGGYFGIKYMENECNSFINENFGEKQIFGGYNYEANEYRPNTYGQTQLNQTSKVGFEID